MKNFKKKILTLALSMTLVFGLTACKGPDGAVAKVNDHLITEQEFAKQYAAVRNSFVIDQANGDLKVLKEKLPNLGNVTVEEYLKDMTLQNLIQQEIINEDAAKEGIKVSDEEVEAQLKKDIEASGGQQEFENSLKKQGLNIDFYKTYLKNKMIAAQYYQKVLEKISPKDDEVKKYYEDHKKDFFNAKASHILVDSEKEAKEIKKELDNGADFSKLAKEKSKDPSAKENGGNLGEFNESTMVEEFTKAVQDMAPGEISKPVKSQFGYHIIKLDEKSPRGFDEVKNEIKSKLLMEEEQEYQEKLEKDAKVKKYMKVSDEVVIPEAYKLDSENASENKTDKKDEKQNSKESKENNKKDNKAENKNNTKEEKKN